VSADNWAICPRCLDRAKAEVAAQLAVAERAYGNVPAAEYEELRAQAQTPIDPEKFRTFREDYEFFGASEGTIVAGYSGHCGTCSLTVDFRDEHKFYEQGDP